MASTSQSILVVGATGKQGGAVIQALLELPATTPPLHILALTRDANSPKAKSLAEAHKSTIDLVEGDVTSPDTIFVSQPKGSIATLFLVTTPGKVDEQQQAIPLIDAAVAHGVQHIVFSSVDRGGDDKSWTNPTNIKHFYQKHNIELHLRDKTQAPGASFTWTILRPVAFLDNMNPGFFCSMFTAMWASALKPDTKLQLVSTRDIGRFAAQALTRPAEWAGRAIGLAGDALTLAEAKETFARVMGKELPQTWTFLGTAVLWGVGDVGNMFAFFENEGYGADIAARRKEVPTQDFATWLRESSLWKDE
ncbi:hypothetical protein B0T22DRAFT_164225 [Podospora appendiculata]|uniref:NmrA-like domain-containing protein n=1 Tax=Podospora appendiculata TaxID=314037 RepID=A0AAE0XAD7_9PEZI|nr:hypothetical protein B0T22DRAFT_164225 [Podospora appendiculata]